MARLAPTPKTTGLERREAVTGLPGSGQLARLFGRLDHLVGGPVLYRRTSLDGAGKVDRITITDSVQGRELWIGPQTKEATVAMLAVGDGDPHGPFARVSDYIDPDELPLPVDLAP
jgi:hypothetical protein